MEENTPQQNNQNKTQLSLAALMFFSPLVQNILKRGNIGLTQEDTKFVKGYIRLGYFGLVLLLISIISGIASYQTTSTTLDTLYTISITITILLLVIGTLGILTNTNILSGDKKLLDIYQENVTSDKKEIVLRYLPLYNIYLRYKEHNFEKPNLLLKESITAWILFCIIGLCTTPFWASIVLMAIILRIASLIGNIDIINPKVKNYINNLFHKNPEELRGYIKGGIMYILKWPPLTKGEAEPKARQGDLRSYIASAKQDFSLLYNVQLHNSVHIKIQYFLLVIAIALWITYINPDFSLRTTTIPAIIILGRYLIMFIRWNHVPELPIFKEITDILTYIWSKLHPVANEIKTHFNNK